MVLSRKIGERVLIGDNITLVVTDISKDKVRIGIEAPKDVKIFRDELFKAGAEGQGVPKE